MRLLFVALVLFSLPVHAATITVAPGGNLQAALDKAAPGDEIVIDRTASFTGEFKLPPKPASINVIVVRSSASLPNRRMLCSKTSCVDGLLMPTLQSGSVFPAIDATNAKGWKFDGIRFGPTLTGQDNVIVQQDSENMVWDRLIFTTPDDVGQKRFMMANGKNITLSRSYIRGVWAQTLQDSQCFCAWDGAGPYKVIDNFLECASENIMFGGAGSASADRIPADILVEGNTMTKNPDWRALASPDGPGRAVKNLFELKAAKRVTVRNNILEGNWPDAQAGFGVVISTRNDNGDAPWSVIEDVLWEYNILRDTFAGINILGYDSYQMSGRTTRVTIRNSIVETNGTAFQLGGEVGKLTIDHNTVDNGYNLIMLYKGAVWPTSENLKEPRLTWYAVEDFTFSNNVGIHNEYGMFGEEAGVGLAALTTDMDSRPGVQTHAKTWVWQHNAVAGDYGNPYPPTTIKLSVPEHLDQFNPDYSLKSTSKYKKAGTNGTDLGAIMQTAPGLIAPGRPILLK
jgi:hypothetical protein